MNDPASATTNVGEALIKALASRQASYAQKDTTLTTGQVVEPPPEAQPVEQADPVETEQPQQAPSYIPQSEAPSEDDFLRDEVTDTADIAALKANLRSGFQKKMTELDKRMKELTEKAGGTLDAQKKAQVLDSLLASPDPAAAIEAARKGLGIATEAEQTQQWFKPRVMKDVLRGRGKLGDGPDFLHESVVEPIEDMIDAYMETKVLPGYLPVLAWVQQQVAKGATSEWDGLAAKYGDTAAKYQRQAYELAARAQIPLETALIAASNGEVVNAQKHAQVERKQAQQLVKSNGLPPTQRGAETYEAKRNKFAQMLLAADKGSKSPQFPQNRI